MSRRIRATLWEEIFGRPGLRGLYRPFSLCRKPFYYS